MKIIFDLLTFIMASALFFFFFEAEKKAYVQFDWAPTVVVPNG